MEGRLAAILEEALSKNAGAVPPLWRLVSRRGSVVTPLNERGEGIPFYCVHSISGEVSSFFTLVRLMGPDRRFHGLQVPKNKMNAAFVPSIEALARHHVRAITAFQPEGAVLIGGWSAGAIVALEVARQLRALGRDVPLLVALDGAPCNSGAGLRRSDPRYAWRLLRNLPGWMRHHVLQSGSWHAIAQEIGEKLAFRLRLNLPRLKGDQPLDQGAVQTVLNAQGWKEGQQGFIRAMYDAMRVYMPQPYTGPVAVYEATIQPLDHLMQVGTIWRAIAPEAEIVPLEGIHDRLMREPTVSRLATHLRARLTAASELTPYHGPLA